MFSSNVYLIHKFSLVFANAKSFCSCQIGAYVGDALFHKYFLSARPITSMNPIFA